MVALMRTIRCVALLGYLSVASMFGCKVVNAELIYYAERGSDFNYQSPQFETEGDLTQAIIDYMKSSASPGDQPIPQCGVDIGVNFDWTYLTENWILFPARGPTDEKQIRIRWATDVDQDGNCVSWYNNFGSPWTLRRSYGIEYYLAAPSECLTTPNNESNPCNPADGSKYQVESDYASPAYGGLSFTRYYKSLGAYRTAEGMGSGWRHSYSRTMDEVPGRRPAARFSAPANQSSTYSTASDACMQGWDEIKSSVWSGDLASATATFLGGNSCKISLGGIAVAYFPVRNTAGWVSEYTQPTTVKTITRANGRTYQFEQSGSAWVNHLQPNTSLEPSGSNWIFTDADDTQETFNASGQLVAITRRNGQTETLEYNLTAAEGGDDNSATLDRVTGHFGHELMFHYDQSGNLERVSTPDGDIHYAYESSAFNKLLSVTYPDATVREYVYEDSSLPSHLTGIIDENVDRYATWDYDSAGRAILSEHFGGKDRVQFAYNIDGSTTLTMGNGATRTYSYSTAHGQRKPTMLSGDVCSTCPGGNIKSRTYDANGFLDEATDWNGNITKTQRNSRGLTETLTEGKGSMEERLTTTIWHSTYRLPTQITSPINVTDFSYDANGNPISISVTDGTTTRAWAFTYNAAGQVLTVDGPRTDVADITAFAYYNCTTGNECGQLESVTNALSQVTTYDTYDASGRLTQMTDPNGLQTSFSYDGRGNLLTVTQTPIVGTPRVTSMTYDNAGQLTTLSLPDGMQVTYTYDAAHYLTSVTDNVGNRIDYAYDAMGNLTDEDTYDPGSALAHTMGYAYDLNNRLDSVTDGGGFVTDLTIDLVGNLTGETDPNLGHTQHSYDALNRLVSTVDAGNGVTNYAYDARDNLIAVTDPRNLTTLYTYDGLDNRIEQDSPDSGVTTFTYDPAGNRLSMTDARGVTVNYSYDALSRLTAIDYPDDSLDVSFAYDACTNGVGRLCTMADGSGNTSYQYDARGNIVARAITVGTVSGSIGYAYDAADRVVKITYPSGRTVDYVRDVVGQVTEVTTTSADGLTTEVLASSITYAPFGPTEAMTWGNGIVLNRSHDLDYRLTDQVAGTVQNLSVGYDANDNVTALTDGLDPSRNQSFSYDALDRLTGATGAYGTHGYSYDPVGNRQTFTGPAGNETYDYAPDSNRLIQFTAGSSSTIQYDANGNITSDGYYGFSYGDHNRVTEARILGSPVATYLYNGLGQRVRKDNGAITHFVYDEGGRLVGEYDAAGFAVQETVWLNGVPLAVIAGGAPYYVHTDHLGTPRAITTGAGTVIWRWDSDPFGNTAADTDPDGDGSHAVYNVRFPGQYFDSETGLHYNYFRDYVPEFGRYLESDPIGLNGGLNTYGYVGANPISRTDPLGLYEGDGTFLGEHFSASISPQWREAQRQLYSDLDKCSPDDEDCITKCLRTYYGNLLDIARDLSPFSLIALGLNEAADFTADELSRQANRNLNSRNYSVGRRQARTLAQFRFFNAAAAVAGSGAAGFLGGAYGTCAFRCAFK